MKKWLFTLLIFLAISNSSPAQGLDEGIKALYYEQYSSAQNFFEKKFRANPKEARAAYWLGQAYLQDPNRSDRIAKARTVYQTALANHFNAPYLLVGMGEIDLLTSNNIVAAKQKFDQAILASQNDPDILNAIGRANAAGNKLTGDPGYAIELLKKVAVQVPENTDVDYNLALNMLKLDASFIQPAIDALLDAIHRNPKYAKAFYKIGLIYSNNNNLPQANTYFQKAIDADPNYGPTYLALANAAIDNNDFLTAENHIKKYISLTENQPNIQYVLAQILLENNNLTKARISITDYIAHNYSSKDFIPNAYSLAARSYREIPDSAKYFYSKAYEYDTIYSDKIEAMDSLIGLYKTEKDSINIYLWSKKKFKTIQHKQETSEYQQFLPQLCAAILKVGPLIQKTEEFDFADSIFKLYIKQYPNEEYGYFGRTRNAQNADPTLAKAQSPLMDYIIFLEKDKSKNKTKILYYHDLLGQYYTNTLKDYQKACAQYQYILLLDPNNARAKDILTKLKQAKSN